MRALILSLAILSSAALCFSCVSHVPKEIHTTPIRRANKKQIVVAVIDTGMDELRMKSTSFLCKDGHYDFTHTSLNDDHGHGTHISFLIDQYVKNIFIKESGVDKLLERKPNYCQVILKYYDSKATGFLSMNADYLVKAIEYAVEKKVDVINISGGGTKPNPAEYVAIEKALDAGIKVIAAAGNDGKDISGYYLHDVFLVPTRNHGWLYDFPMKVERYFPAAYDSRIIIVGNGTDQEHRAKNSNYGDIVNAWEDGVDVVSALTNMNGYLSGTSQSTAIRTGKVVRQLLSH